MWKSFVVFTIFFSGILACSGRGDNNDEQRINGRRGQRGNFSRKFSSVQECQRYFENRLGCLSQLDISLDREALKESLRACHQKYREANKSNDSSRGSDRDGRGRGHRGEDRCDNEDNAIWIQCLKDQLNSRKERICTVTGIGAKTGTESVSTR